MTITRIRRNTATAKKIMTTLKSDGISTVLEPIGAAACWMTGGW
jgi:hypothetical protein